MGGKAYLYLALGPDTKLPESTRKIEVCISFPLIGHCCSWLPTQQVPCRSTQLQVLPYTCLLLDVQTEIEVDITRHHFTFWHRLLKDAPGGSQVRTVRSTDGTPTHALLVPW
jgi:hypothetical protein